MHSDTDATALTSQTSQLAAAAPDTSPAAHALHTPAPSAAKKPAVQADLLWPPEQAWPAGQVVHALLATYSAGFAASA